MVGLLAKKGKGYYLFPSIGKATENPEQLFQLPTSDSAAGEGNAVSNHR
jgi:hypothetical protein